MTGTIYICADALLTGGKQEKKKKIEQKSIKFEKSSC